jgi:hypothetical protein
MNATPTFRMAGWLVRDMHGLMEEVSLRAVSINTRIVIFTPELAATYFTETGRRAQLAGVIDQAAFDRWAAGIEDLQKCGRLFCGIGYYLFTARVSPGCLSVPEAALTVVEVKQHEQPHRDEPVGEDGQEIVGRIVPFDDHLADMAVGRAKHEQRPAEARRQPEQAADQMQRKPRTPQAPSYRPTSN